MLLEILFLCGTHRNCVIEIRAIASSQQQPRCAGKVQGLNYSTNRDGSQASNSGRFFDTCTTRQHYTTNILSRKPFACILVRSRSRDFYTIYFGGIAEIPVLCPSRTSANNRTDISRGYPEPAYCGVQSTAIAIRRSSWGCMIRCYVADLEIGSTDHEWYALNA